MSAGRKDVKTRAGADTGFQCQEKQGTVLCAGGWADKNHIQRLAGVGSMLWRPPKHRVTLILEGSVVCRRGTGGEAVYSGKVTQHTDFPCWW